MTTKRTLLGECVLRRDGSGQLFLMNRKETGWGSYAISMSSEESFLSKYNATLGEWSKDEHGDYCPVTPIEHKTSPATVALAVAMVDAHELLEGPNELEAFKQLMDAMGPRTVLVDDGYKPRVLQGRIEIHDGVLVLHDCGMRGQSHEAIGAASNLVAGMLTVPYSREDQLYAQKVSLTQEQSAALKENMVPIRSFVSDDLNHEGLRKLLAAQPISSVVVSVGSDLREYCRSGSDGEVLKVRMDSGKMESLEAMLAENGLKLVPIVIDGKVVQTDGYKFKHTGDK